MHDCSHQLAMSMERVNEDHAPVIVTRPKGEPVVIMSLANFNALQFALAGYGHAIACRGGGALD